MRRDAKEPPNINDVIDLSSFASQDMMRKSITKGKIGLVLSGLRHWSIFDENDLFDNVTPTCSSCRLRFKRIVDFFRHATIMHGQPDAVAIHYFKRVLEMKW